MPLYTPTPPYTHHRHPSPVGVLLVNLGTPDSPTVFAVRRYLREFLSDRRVVELPSLLWKTLLNTVVLQVAAPRAAASYQKIWDTVENDSPLRVFSRQQAEKLQHALVDADENVRVAYGMRYGNPSIDSAVKELKTAGCERIVLLPLYPQYAGATTAAAYEATFEALKQWRWVPALSTVAPYHDHPDYIEAIADGIRPHLNKKTEKLIFSFHGIPTKYFKDGDPYPCHCWKTARLVTEQLGLSPAQVMTTFQSRFGRGEWLTPATDETLVELAKQGTKNIVIATPGFFSDCVETLEEIHIQGRDTFLANGGKSYTAVPCLNDSPDAIRLLQTLLAPHLSN